METAIVYMCLEVCTGVLTLKAQMPKPDECSQKVGTMPSPKASKWASSLRILKQFHTAEQTLCSHDFDLYRRAQVSKPRSASVSFPFWGSGAAASPGARQADFFKGLLR